MIKMKIKITRTKWLHFHSSTVTTHIEACYWLIKIITIPCPKLQIYYLFDIFQATILKYNIFTCSWNI